jgi:ferredoxin
MTLENQEIESPTNTFDTQHPPSRALIDACVHCGFCLPSCPTYALWGEEMDSPRGRIYLMKAGLDGRAALSPSFVEHFDTCLGCMACVTACPSGVQYAPLIETTRGQIDRRYERSIGDRLFRRLIFAIVPHPTRSRRSRCSRWSSAAHRSAVDDNVRSTSRERLTTNDGQRSLNAARRTSKLERRPRVWRQGFAQSSRSRRA